MRYLVLAAIAVALSGCTTLARTSSYGMELADAQPVVDGRAYRIYVHPRDDTLLIQPPIPTGIGRGLVTGATLGLAQPGQAYDPWKRAAATFLEPVHCTVTDVYPLGQNTATWEARFTCPPGVDLRALVAAQRAALRAGAALRP